MMSQPSVLTNGSAEIRKHERETLLSFMATKAQMRIVEKRGSVNPEDCANKYLGESKQSRAADIAINFFSRRYVYTPKDPVRMQIELNNFIPFQLNIDVNPEDSKMKTGLAQ